MPDTDPQEKWVWDKRTNRHRSSVPNHGDEHHSAAQREGNVFEHGSVQFDFTFRDVTLRYEMVDGHIDEHPGGEAHGDGINPICSFSLRCGVDGDSNGDPDRARDGERKGIGHTGQQRPIWHHSEKRNPH